MSEEPTNLDKHRSHVAQAATDARRLTSEVRENQAKLRTRQQELERYLFASTASDWPEAAKKARYLLTILARMPGAEDPRVQTMISDVLADFDRLAGGSPPDAGNDPF